MECYYHPERESTDICAICGKSICKECGLEIAGKIYCKECLEKIVGLGIDNSPRQPERAVAPEPVRLNKQPIEDNVYQPQTEQVAYTPQEEIQPVHEIKQISDDSPYNIKDKIEKMKAPLNSRNINTSKDLIIFIILTLHEELNKHNTLNSNIFENSCKVNCKYEMQKFYNLQNMFGTLFKDSRDFIKNLIKFYHVKYYESIINR